MAGFEIIVRPVVFPNIRPQPTRALTIADAPDKGICTIRGGGGGIVDLPYSVSNSWSKSRMVEVRRHFDKARIYYTRPDGTFDKSKYWEFEVLTSIEYLENGMTAWGQQFAPMPEGDNVEVINRGLTRENK